MSEIIVIGGGAAGMMAAIAASERGHHVVLLEKNEKLGKKLFITGKGRCNITNAAEGEDFFANVCTNSKFLYSAFYAYDNRAVTELLEQEGCPVKTERGGRVFPETDHSSDVIAALQRALKKRGVEILLHTEAKALQWKENGASGGSDGWSGTVRGVELKNGGIMPADAVVVCTGGLSYPSTGSTGDGYGFARETGHNVTACRPSLVPLEAAEDWCGDLMGLSLKNVRMRLLRGGRELYSEQGEMLFTHFGVSGPLVLSASCHLGKADAGRRKKPKADTESGGSEAVELVIDLKPALDEESLDRRLLRDFEENQNRQFKNALGGLFPAKLIPVMVRLSGIAPEKRTNEITREERKRFASLIKHLTLNVTGTRSYAEAVITQGGVDVRQINPSTMESKKIKGLYFAGEVLDLDAYTGGFNLQIAWSTGHLAGESAAEAAAEKEETKRMSYNIAIDGPAGAGKSTIAKAVAKKLNFIYVDTGAMYRAMALFMIREGVDPADAEAISEKCREADITIAYEGSEQVVYLNGENVNPYLRTEEVGNMASATSVQPAVREKLVELQQALAAKSDCIMDGRDIGTCVLPNAQVKVYLTASSAVRAKRRYDELAAKGEKCDLAKIQADIEERDYRDMHREHSPLKQAEDAVLVDSSDMTVEEVIGKIMSLCGK